MSSQKSKQKKPFLKRGSRQFLSNAQVRSQNEKPKLVDFGAQQQQSPVVPVFKARSSQNVDPNNENISIKVAPNSTKQISTKKVSQNLMNKNSRPPVSKNIDTNISKVNRQTSIGKKKQATLADYLDNQSYDDYSNTKPSTYTNKNTYKKPQSKKPIEDRQQKQKPRHSYLVQQDEGQQQQNNIMQNDSFKPIKNNIKNRQSIHNENQSRPNKDKTKVNHQSDEQKQINFVSDKSDDQQLPKFHKPKAKAEKQLNNYIYDKSQNDHQIQENQPHISKIKMNYFNKNTQKPKNSITGLNDDIKNKDTVPVWKKQQLSISDIPKQLKQQIVKETIAQKQQELQQQFNKLKEKFAAVKRDKQKLQQDHRLLTKAKTQFQKQMEQKNKQFQEKIKNQNSKLARQKKYMKDVQMSGQGDRKFKNQLQDIRKLLQKQKDEKKKIQAKYKAQIQGLRKKLNEQTSKNKLLSQQIKLLEYGQILHKEQLQDMTKQQKKNLVQKHKSNMWSDAPQSTFLRRFMQDQFTLIQLQPNQFNYNENEYYQYYSKIQNDCDELQSQKADQDRIKRQYKNGKVEVEQIKKYLKQVFPFNYTVVSLWNGDIKQTLPQGIVVYYSKNSQATQYCIKNGNLQKQIVYFPSSQTVQMKVTKHNDPENSYTEVYCSGHLKRTYNNGSVMLQRKDQKGKVVSMPLNY